MQLFEVSIYLGVYFTSDGKMDRAVQDRISVDEKAFWRAGKNLER